MEIIEFLMGLIKVENEENTIVCMKTIMDFQRNQAAVTTVQPFLNLIQEMFEGMSQVVKDTFETVPQSGSTVSTPAQMFASPHPNSPSASNAMDLNIDAQSTKPLPKGMHSFKALSECPIIVVSLFQAHKALVANSVKAFIPLIKAILTTQAKPQQIAHEEAEKRGTIFTGVSKDIKNRAAFGDFITAQVKTMSFLAYLLKPYHKLLEDFLPTLPDICIRLLRDCPSERSAARKELLVAIRHIINFNFRGFFSSKVNELLDERTLIGDGLTVYETMRPLAYSMLADLIHHVRDRLEAEQVQKTIELFSKNMLEDFPGTSFQTMSAKLLLSMADSIASMENKKDGRYFLIMILRAIAEKFAQMNKELPNAMKISKQLEETRGIVPRETHLAESVKPPDWDETDIFSATPIKTSMPRDVAANPVDDNRFLFKNLMTGLKNLFYRLKLTNPEPLAINPENAPANWNDVAFGFTAEEVEVITRLFHEGAGVFRYYSLKAPSSDAQYASPIEYLANLYMQQSEPEERDLLETFATVFHCIDPATFHEVFEHEIPLLYEMMFEHTALLHIPQFFLASEATSPSFAGMLLQFLMDKIGDVGSSDVKKSSILLRMFKLSFMAVTLFCTQNEQVLQPHVTKLVTQAIKLSTTAEEPMNYFYLLRSLFRSIGGGRFEGLYKEILPLLEMLLEVLNNLLAAARKPQERHLYVELCLTVPARLSNLLPHLSYLMRPLVIALRADHDLVGQGLRTLELCVDNLTADYLDPLVAPVIDDLMQALWDHLRPAPYDHFLSHSTMRILGKLGGRNRRFLTGAPTLNSSAYADDQSSFDLKLIGSTKDRAFPNTIGIDLAINKLKDVPKSPQGKKADVFYKQMSFRMISAQLKLYISHEQLPEDFAQMLRLQANDLLEGNLAGGTDCLDKLEREGSVAKKYATEETVRKLLGACIYATTIPDLKAASWSLLHDVCRHFAITDIGVTLATYKHRKKPFEVKSGEGPLTVDTKVLSDAITLSLASDNPEVRDSAEQVMQYLFEVATTLFGSAEKADRLPLFSQLARTLCHDCYEEEWYTKAAGALGIGIFVNKMSMRDQWLKEKQIDFIRALVFLIKDVPLDLPIKTRVGAQTLLETILKRCNQGADKGELANHQSRLYQLSGHLVLEISHMNKHVRDAAQSAISLLAQCMDTEAHELITPFKERILQPIYNKPLRALAFPVQIGYIDAITYCLKLQHGILTYNDQLHRLVFEALALTEADDETLAQKPGEYRTAEWLVKLRVSSIKLLSQVLSVPEFANQDTNPPPRNKIVGIFFKSLYSISTDVSDAAYEGLRAVLGQTNKLQKDLLQTGLRPILMTLQDHKKVNTHTLDGLARLLRLLTNYFKVEIGDRLINYMEIISNEPSVQKTSFSLIEQNSQMKIVTATLNIFHLLPSMAISMMPKLVLRVLDLESKLRRTKHSPFREPLLRYLSRYSKESCEFFIGKLDDSNHSRFFAQILKNPASQRLREAVIDAIDHLLNKCFPKDSKRDNLLAINGIDILHSLSLYKAEKLAKKSEIKDLVLDVGRGLLATQKMNQMEPDLRLAASRAGEQVTRILIEYLKAQPDDLDFMFHWVEVMTTDSFQLGLELKHFIYMHIICHDSVSYWKSIVLRCFDFYNARGTNQRMKTFLFRNLVNPIFAMDVMRTQRDSDDSSARLMDKAMLDAIHNRLWRPQMPDVNDENSSPGVDHSRLELLQLSALLLKYHQALVAEARKDIIKLGWAFIRLEDNINKHAAYVLIAFFIAQFDSPAKIVNQVYVALLKAHQNEGKALVTQALDLIGPVLPKRLQSSNDPKYPLWAKLAKRIISEENTNLQQLMSVFQFIIRHPDLFYEAREYFVTLMISSLQKIAPAPSSPSTDMKKLALNLIELIRNWEYRRVTGLSVVPGAAEAKRKVIDDDAMVTDPPVNSTTADKSEYQIPANYRTMLVKYLAQLVSTFVERYPVPAQKLRELTPNDKLIPLPPNDLCKKAFGLFHDLLSSTFWGDLEIDLFPKLTQAILASEKTEKALASDGTDRPEEKTLTYIINTLQIVRVILDSRSDAWIQNQIPLIQKLLDKALKSDNPEIQDCLHASDTEYDGGREVRPLLRRVLDVIPQEGGDEDEMEVETPGTEFIKHLSTLATEAMANNNLCSGINLIWTLSQVRPALIDIHVPAVMKALQQKLAKDHVTNAMQSKGQPNAQPTPNAEKPGPVLTSRDAEIQALLILKTIDIVALRMGTLGDQRRPFLSVLASLVDKSLDLRLCDKILLMVENWIFDSTDPWPTLKEKTAVLHKMLNFEARSDPTLLHKFLDLVIRIYEDPKITRTELTVRLEHAFLVGTRAQDVAMRNRFMTIIDKSLTRTSTSRLLYVLTSQNWDTLAETFWLSQAVELVLGSMDLQATLRLHPDDFKTVPLMLVFNKDDVRKEGVMVDDSLEDLISNHRRFYQSIADVKARDILEPLWQLQHTDNETAHQLWVALFPLCWSALSKDDRMELEKGMVSLLTKDYHQRQIDRRPNVIQTLLEGIARAKPKFKLPPHVLKFLSKTYDAWYTALHIFEDRAINPIIDMPVLRESNLDALVETYAGLQEDDLYYGAWRRRCKFVETNAALSYEQAGMWDKAQQLYEVAQVKARTGSVPFSNAEYMLWEDHWVLCAQKLQQWDILSEFAKHENFNDLLLESSYRQYEMWSKPENLESINQIIKAVSDAPTPRRMFFQSFVSLLKYNEKSETREDFLRVCDEATQLSIRKWHQLPKRTTGAHIPILQGFQQLVELQDAQMIFQSLHQTTASNLDQKSQELKLLLASWRDRLPNIWDDINAWQSLVTWRQHIFHQINQTYLSLIQQPNGTTNTGNSFAYRGYHETAWIINRFAHVARKHQLPEVCISQLGKIYTLPNIEIQEAFLKLREQAKCHYQNPAELTTGLEVINNTNLNYFGAQQKAEFFTLKGMFQAKLNSKEEANDAFGTALYYDIRLPKAWAEWGYYNDSIFKEEPDNYQVAAAAVSCYLEAASLYKNAKARKMLGRILWLLSIDSADQKIAKAFTDFKGDPPTWYWITFIPQLLTSLSQREANIACDLLIKIAKVFPQALYFQLRTQREDMLALKKQTEAKERAKQQGVTKQDAPKSEPSTGNKDGSRPGTANKDATSRETTSNGTAVATTDGAVATSVSNGTSGSPKTNSETKTEEATENVQELVKEKKPWEWSEEIIQVLKTAFPLLALSIETMVDQIQKHFKCPADEDAYRLINALLNDGFSHIGRSPTAYAQDVKLPPLTEANIRKFAETILPSHIRGAFEEDFVTKKPTMYEYIHRLRRWRDKFEEKLDRRPSQASLESYSGHLSEFRFQKFDDVEVPGQYLLHKDKNSDFIRIERFLPNIDLVRSVGFSHRRIRIRGHDGSVHTFAIQSPAARHSRREERNFQLFRIFNGILSKRKEARRRNLNFFLPLVIPLAPSIRLLQEDTQYVSLQSVYEDHARRNGFNRDEPILFTMEKLRTISELKNNRFPEQIHQLKMEAFSAIQDKWVPNDVALEYFQYTYPNFADFWLFRRQFSYQFASHTFMCYVMHMTNRYPHKVSIARNTGNVWGLELTSFMPNNKCLFNNPELVPFRFTPNIHTLIGPIATEGIFTCALMAIARCLSDPEIELEHQLSVFIRDEVLFWYTQQHKPVDGQLRDRVQQNSDIIVNKSLALASPPKGNLPANQTVIDSISQATDPMRLCQADILWMPYL